MSGAGGLPLRVGLRDGNTRDRVETPLAMEACLARGLAGVRGLVADRKASSQRTLGRCREHGIGLGTLVPRPGAVRQARAAWGQPQPAWPLLAETPGRTPREEPRRGQGPSVIRQVEVASRDGRVAQEAWRFVVVHSRQRAEPQAHTAAVAQAQDAAAIADQVSRVDARRVAWVAETEAASAADDGRGQGRRGRRPRPWRHHAVPYRRVTDMRRTRRARRGRPAQTEPPPIEPCDRLGVEGEPLDSAAEEHGGTVLATTVRPEVGADAASLHAYQEQHMTVEPGVRWLTNPAAMSPGWLEQPERSAAVAMLTVLGWLV